MYMRGTRPDDDDAVAVADDDGDTGSADNDDPSKEVAPNAPFLALLSFLPPAERGRGSRTGQLGQRALGVSPQWKVVVASPCWAKRPKNLANKNTKKLPPNVWSYTTRWAPYLVLNEVLGPPRNVFSLNVYKWVTGTITPRSGMIAILITTAFWAHLVCQLSDKNPANSRKGWHFYSRLTVNCALILAWKCCELVIALGSPPWKDMEHMQL